jgi:hypothetical protein
LPSPLQLWHETRREANDETRPTSVPAVRGRSRRSRWVRAVGVVGGAPLDGHCPGYQDNQGAMRWWDGRQWFRSLPRPPFAALELTAASPAHVRHAGERCGTCGLTYTIEYDGSGLLEVDCPSVSFDLTHLDSRGARLRALRPTVAAHLKSVTVQKVSRRSDHTVATPESPAGERVGAGGGRYLAAIPPAGSKTPPVITIPRWQDGEVTGGARKDVTA